jgi:hypothetical protein
MAAFGRSLRVPYNGREGGYQYLNGGPYDAESEINKHFPGGDPSRVEKAVEKIQREGEGVTDWVKNDEY